MDAADRERWWWERGTAELRDLLYREWDPIGVKELADDSADEYEAYAGQIVRRLRAGADETEVADLLAGFREDMGLGPADPPLDTARRIVEWYHSARARTSGP